METLRDLDLVRALPPQAHAIGIRAATPAEPPEAGEEETPDQEAPPNPGDTGELGRLVVRFSPFGTWYRVCDPFEGDFMEQTVRGAFTKTMREQGANVKVQFDHGYDTAVGSRVLCLADELREDPDSAVLEGDLFDTSYNRDLRPGIATGAYGSSFRFQVLQESWNDEPGTSPYNPNGLPERTITEVRLFEAGPVVFPANPAATAGVRSMTAAFWERARQRDPQVEGLLARARQLRAPKAQIHVPGFVGTPGQLAATLADVLDRNRSNSTSPAPEAADGTSEPAEAAPITTETEPASSHSGGYLPHQRRALIHPILSRKDTP